MVDPKRRVHCPSAERDRKDTWLNNDHLFTHWMGLKTSVTEWGRLLAGGGKGIESLNYTWAKTRRWFFFPFALEEGCKVHVSAQPLEVRPEYRLWCLMVQSHGLNRKSRETAPHSFTAACFSMTLSLPLLTTRSTAVSLFAPNYTNMAKWHQHTSKKGCPVQNPSQKCKHT